MSRKYRDRELEKRIRSGQLTREDVARKLAELAFGQVNDCVKLVLEQKPEVEKLDLGALCEVRRNDKGTVEIKLVDRLQALEQLCQMTQQDEGGVEIFLRALGGKTTEK